MSDHCMHVRAQLEALVDGDLEASAAARLKAHLGSCAACRAEHELAASLPSRLRALKAPAPPPELLPAVLRAVQRERLRSRLGPALGAAEAVLVALAVWYLSGIQGLAGLGARIAGEASQLLGWGTGAADLPAPPAGDLFVLLVSLALALVCAFHLALLSQPTGPRRRA
jgi:predicted anti-sigma-YlaC factor YlaD